MRIFRSAAARELGGASSKLRYLYIAHTRNFVAIKDQALILTFGAMAGAERSTR